MAQSPRPAVVATGRRWAMWWSVLSALLLPLPAAAQGSDVVYEVRSQYQTITVLDTPSGCRRLIFDRGVRGFGAVQSEMDLANPDVPTLSYVRHVMVALPIVPRPRRILVVGLGGASIQRFVRKLLPEATIETAELDPAIRDVAAKYFRFQEDARQVVHIGDGRAFIERSPHKYDLIVIDAFSATSTPYHLTTREFLQAVRNHLADGGIVCANLWETASSFWDVVRTYSVVFPELRLVRCAGSGNSLVMAWPVKAGVTVEDWTRAAAAFEKAHPTGLELPNLIQRGTEETTIIPDTAVVLVDKEDDARLDSPHAADSTPGPLM
jgi:spermidine synthase